MKLSNMNYLEKDRWFWSPDEVLFKSDSIELPANCSGDQSGVATQTSLANHKVTKVVCQAPTLGDFKPILARF